VSHARIQAAGHPDATDLASGGLGTLLGIDRNATYVQQPLAPYVDPPLPWPGSNTGANDAAAHALAIARTFHAAHATDWCNRFHAGAPDGTDLELLRSHVHVLKDSGIGGEDLDAACAACQTFVSRRLRVGKNEGDYDTAREPLCHFLADDPASAQYVYQPGTGIDTVEALAGVYCGCAVSCLAPVAVPIHTSFEHFTAGPGAVFFDQTVDFTFTGGKVVLSQDPDGTGDVFVDDEIIITVTHPDLTTATLDHDYSTGCSGRITHTAPQDVTALLEPGVNHVRVQFKNTCGGNASAESYWLVGGCAG